MAAKKGEFHIRDQKTTQNNSLFSSLHSQISFKNTDYKVTTKRIARRWCTHETLCLTMCWLEIIFLLNVLCVFIWMRNNIDFNDNKTALAALSVAKVLSVKETKIFLVVKLQHEFEYWWQKQTERQRCKGHFYVKWLLNGARKTSSSSPFNSCAVFMLISII